MTEAHTRNVRTVRNAASDLGEISSPEGTTQDGPTAVREEAVGMDKIAKEIEEKGGGEEGGGQDLGKNYHCIEVGASEEAEDRT